MIVVGIVVMLLMRCNGMKYDEKNGIYEKILMKRLVGVF